MQEHLRKIKSGLLYLYGKDGLVTYNRLINTLASFKTVADSQSLTSEGNESFSEKDVFLITYPNHIYENSVKPLKSLKKFLALFAKKYFNRIHILPIYPFSSDDGFSVIDYYKVSPGNGGWDDIQSLATEFALMIDFVPNHVSASSEWFQEFLAGNAKYQNYFLHFPKPVDYSKVYRPRAHPLLTLFKTKSGPKYLWTTFSADQIDLNVNNSEVFLELVRVLLFYVSQGVKSIRIDAVGYLWKDINTQSAHLPQTHMIIKIFREILEYIQADVWLIPQANTLLHLNMAYLGNGSDEAHIIYNFTLPPLLLYTLILENAQKLTEWAASLPKMHKNNTFLNITATHDGIGLQPIRNIVSKTEINKMVEKVIKNGGQVNYRALGDGSQEPYEINSVYRSAIGNDAKFIASQAIQISLKGIPAIYLNSLIGEGNWLEGIKELKYNRAINRRKFDYNQLKLELMDKTTTKSKIYTEYTHLLKTRRAEKLFNPNSEQEILQIHPQIFALKRMNDQNILICLTNISSRVITIKSPIRPKTKVRELLTRKSFVSKPNLTLEPSQILWLKYTH